MKKIITTARWGIKTCAYEEGKIQNRWHNTLQENQNFVFQLQCTIFVVEREYIRWEYLFIKEWRYQKWSNNTHHIARLLNSSFPINDNKTYLHSKLRWLPGSCDLFFVLRVKRMCHARRYERVEALTFLQRSSLISEYSARYRSSPPHTTAPAHVIPSHTTSPLLKYSDWSICRNV
jgi:hypothetical protein